MNRRPLHSISSALVALLLLLQHAPLYYAGVAGPDHHRCVECTKNYCTQDRCFCGHEHRHGGAESHGTHDATAPHRGHDRAAAASNGSPLSDHAEHPADATPSTRTDFAQHAADAPHSAKLVSQPAPPAAAAGQVAVRPCSPDGAHGVPVFHVDRFVVIGTHSGEYPVGDLHRPLATSTSRPAQTMGDEVFHPPLSAYL